MAGGMTWLNVLVTILVAIVIFKGGRDPASDPITGRVVALIFVLAAALLFHEAGLKSEMIADQAVWRRGTYLFSFWCAVIAVCCPPPMGVQIVGKAWFLGLGALLVSVAWEWSYQFALSGEFDTPRFSLLVAADIRILVAHLRTHRAAATAKGGAGNLGGSSGKGPYFHRVRRPVQRCGSDPRDLALGHDTRGCASGVPVGFRCPQPGWHSLLIRAP
jgi:hypothetical protein